MKPNDVLDFWSGIGPKGWWVKNPHVDAQIHEKFSKLHQDACDGKLDDWAETANGALALVIILDQFSRNMFRNNAKSFAQDAKALTLAKQSVAKGLMAKPRKTCAFSFIYHLNTQKMLKTRISPLNFFKLIMAHQSL